MVRKMFVLIAQFKIQEGHRDAVVAALVEDAGSSVSVEPGCYQFDVSQDESDPNTIYAYEIYADEDAFEAHTRTPHLAKWREASQGRDRSEGNLPGINNLPRMTPSGRADRRRHVRRIILSDWTNLAHCRRISARFWYVRLRAPACNARQELRRLPT